MSTRTRFGIAFGALGFVAVALGAATFGVLAGSASARVVCSHSTPPRDPIAAAFRFISTEIDRRQPTRAYALVTPSFRGNAGCREFASKQVEGVNFGRVDWRRSTYHVVAARTDRLVVNVVLLGPGTRPAIAGFVMALRHSHASGGWQVGFWSRRKVEPRELEGRAIAA